MPRSPHWSQLTRTEPGRGASVTDDGDSPTVKSKSIPNVSTRRLRMALAAIHDSIHTPHGLHAFSDPRRSLIDQGIKARLIAHELQLRGVTTECRYCSGRAQENPS